MTHDPIGVIESGIAAPLPKGYARLRAGLAEQIEHYPAEAIAHLICVLLDSRHVACTKQEGER